MQSGGPHLRPAAKRGPLGTSLQMSNMMRAHPGEELEIKTEEARALFAAWQNWRGDALMPSRDDMVLSDITALMPYLTLLEIRSPDEFIVRLAGTAILEATGFELTGTNYLDLAAPELRPLRSARVWRQAQQPCGSLMHNRHGPGGGFDRWVEVLSLPMRAANSEGPIQFLGVTAMIDPGLLLLGDFVSEVAKVADRFTSIDIGAGVPADPDEALFAQDT